MSKETAVGRLAPWPAGRDAVADEHPTVVLDIAALDDPIELPQLPEPPHIPDHRPLPDELRGMYYHG